MCPVSNRQVQQSTQSKLMHIDITPLAAICYVTPCNFRFYIYHLETVFCWCSVFRSCSNLNLIVHTCFKHGSINFNPPIRTFTLHRNSNANIGLKQYIEIDISNYALKLGILITPKSLIYSAYFFTQKLCLISILMTVKIISNTFT